MNKKIFTSGMGNNTYKTCLFCSYETRTKMQQKLHKKIRQNPDRLIRLDHLI